MEHQNAKPEPLTDLKQFQQNDIFADKIGIELVEMAPGRAVTKLKVEDRHRNGVGTVQGGALFTLADLAFAAAANAYGTIAVGINCTMNFVRAARGGVLTAIATEDSCNPKISSYSVRITDERNRLIATFTGMAYRKPEPYPTKKQA